MHPSHAKGDRDQAEQGRTRRDRKARRTGGDAEQAQNAQEGGRGDVPRIRTRPTPELTVRYLMPIRECCCWSETICCRATMAV